MVDIPGMKTLSLIRDLNRQGIDRMSLMIRHSKRHYNKAIHMEPFMCLTEEGRNFAYQFGAGLPENLGLLFFSSNIGRCIETSYLIDKGFVYKTNGYTEHNQISRFVTPFYVNDLSNVVEIVQKNDVSTFIRSWIDGKISEDIMMNAEETANSMLLYMAGGLIESEANTLRISVTHDWNIYILKEFALGLPHEEYGKIDYLEGVVVFEKNRELYVASHQKDPVKLNLP